MKLANNFLDSEWSEKAIGFTLLCFFFFLSLHTLYWVKSLDQKFYPDPSSDPKLYQVITFGRSFSDFHDSSFGRGKIYRLITQKPVHFTVYSILCLLQLKK